MQNTEQKLDVYTQHQKSNEDSRETDKRALLICAGQMQGCIEANDQRLGPYQEAIKKNQKLWTMFQVALTDPENALPQDLKILLLNLSRYIDKVSFQAIPSYNPALVKSLVNINRILAEGLAKSLKSLPPVALAPNPMQQMSARESAEMTTSGSITA